MLADTHCGGTDLATVPEPARRAASQADAVVHAGDVTSPGALDALRSLAPAYVVLGNNDHDLVGTLPERLLLDLDGVAVGVVHDAGRRDGRAARLRRWFPTADVVVFGHSHVPCNEVGLEGQVLFNPGSPTQRRAQPRRTYGVLDLTAGRVVRRAVVPL